MQEQIESLKQKIFEQKVKLEKCQQINLQLEDKYIFKEQQQNKQIKKYFKVLHQSILETTQLERQAKRIELQKVKERLGSLINRRDGHRFVELWQDGGEIRKTKEKAIKLKNQITELDSEKREILQKQQIMRNKGMNQINHSQQQLNFFQPFQQGEQNTNEITINKEYYNEKITRIHFQKVIIERELIQLEQKLKNLDVEKVQYVKEYKRIREENNCRFSKSTNNYTKWPMLKNRYQITSLLGKGGFSEVYKAFDMESMRWVACKIHQLHSQWTEVVKNNYIKHAIRENKIHKSLNHPNIVKLYDTVEIDKNSFCTVLEFCEGGDLSIFRKKVLKIPENEAKLIVKQLLSAIKYLKDQTETIIHYDIKPQNVLFHKGEIKITDFGLCKVMRQQDQSKMNLTSQGVGTYWYLPPECFKTGEGENKPQISEKVDIFSIGVIFYELVFGKRPFGHKMSQQRIYKEQIMLRCKEVEFPQTPAMSKEGKQFIKMLLQHDQDQRIGVNEAYNSAYLKKKKK